MPFEKLAELEKTKTYVVLTKSDTLYNFYVRDAFERYWTFNDYEFIDYEKYMTLSSDSRLSFFLVLDYSGTHERFDKKTGPTFYSDGIPKEEEEVAVRSKRPTRTTSAKKVQLSPAELDSLNKLPGLFLCIKYGTNYVREMPTYKKQYTAYSTLAGTTIIHTPKMYLIVQLFQNTMRLIKDRKLKKISYGKDARKNYPDKINLEGKKIIYFKGDVALRKAGLGGTVGYKKTLKFLDGKNYAEYLDCPVEVVNEEELLASLNEEDENNLYYHYYDNGAYTVTFLLKYKGEVVYMRKISSVNVGHFGTTLRWRKVLRALNKVIKS